MRRLATIAVVLLATGGLRGGETSPAVDGVGSGPRPSPTPISWQLDFKYVPPRRIAVKVAGSQRPQIYWYMLYTVVNNGDATRYFFPTFELVTDDLRVIPTDTGISPIVFDAIRERHKVAFKYLVPPSRAIGPLRVGDDYARESVAIWRADDIDTETFTIYVSGLSGEARILRNPAYKPGVPETKTVRDALGIERVVSVNPRHFTLRKTLELSYVLPASQRYRDFIEPRLLGSRWIMR